MIRRLLHFALPICAALTSRAAAAQSSGLLLGLRTSNDSAGEYRTYWIAPENGGVHLVASGPDLLVPRRSGFWRVCLVSGHELNDDELGEFDSIVARPATPARSICAIPPREITEKEHDAARCTMSSESVILFVGSDVVSREVHEESNCGAHYSGGQHAELESLDDGKRVDYATALDSAQTNALQAATVRAARAEFADFGEVDTAASEPGDGDVHAHLTTLDEWAIERGQGHWQTVGQADCSPYVACGDMLRRFSVAYQPPRKLVGHDDVSPSFSAIKARVPHLLDAVSSPRGDMLIALTADSLLVFAPHGGTLGDPVFRIPVSGQIVMAQWAVGRFVPIWTEKLKTLLH